ncbi:hypothetical protein CEUSTIGMA_g8296.t1 [Chlamydomonas eustigma]|uniref:RING-type domain-containing protein n=1 Tax=Chlamydomonas eustigma TaxID=1157962 RepID=A0A250XCQ5_9CHLO|nr:hypothetical protein CEUSTIGMA_g8296.t1 [Chlamydomonas eustigma]|eukprot:GAX80861.1 hypothetical protein CEUSTIGMA_g8296.t1 [Chlamydomonas eustigma]
MSEHLGSPRPPETQQLHTLVDRTHEEGAQELRNIDNVSTRAEDDIEAPMTPTARNNEAVPSPEDTSTSSQVAVVSNTQPDSTLLTQPMILTPSRLRIDSRVLVAHTSTQWLMNMVFAILIQVKLGGPCQDISWWAIFSPTWVSSASQVALNVAVLTGTKDMMYRQLGPPPPETASGRLHLHYNFLLRARTKSHIIDAINGLVDCVAMLTVKVVFCWCLTLPNGLSSMSMRLMFTPFWVCWVIATILHCLKDRTERVFGSTRDLLYIFLLFVACQVDGQTNYSWSVVFMVPWIWFSALFLLSWMVLTLLMFARVWARALDLILPLGFLFLLLSTVPQFVSYLNLTKLLDQDSDTTYAEITIPNAASWFAMWLSSLVIAYGLRQKERLRDVLLASGAVWTHHEELARRMQNDQEAVKRRIDGLSEEEIAKLVSEMMEGKTKPGQLKRVGNTLYKRLQDVVEGAATDGRTPMQDPKKLCVDAACLQQDLSELQLISTRVEPCEVAGDHTQGEVSGNNPHTASPSTACTITLFQEDPSSSAAVASTGSPCRPSTASSRQLRSVPSLSVDEPAQPSGLCMEALSSPSTTQLTMVQPPNAPSSSQASLAALTRVSDSASATGERGENRAPAGVTRSSRCETEMSTPSVSVAGTLLRTCSSTKIVPTGPSTTAACTSASPPAAPGGLIVGMARNLGLTDEPDWKAPEAGTPSGEEELDARALATAAAAAQEDANDDLCVICYDQPPSCVFLECGHGGFCKRCAHRLFVRPPGECPTCRQNIDQVVELAELTPIGHVTAVR